jgi:hypothetical protein
MIIYLLFPLGRRVVKKGCGNLGTQSSIYDERERKKEERWREEASKTRGVVLALPFTLKKCTYLKGEKKNYENSNDLFHHAKK